MEEKQNPGIYELVADLILRCGLAMECIAVAGEIISPDARLRAYGGVLHQHIGLGDLGDHFDVYEATLERCKLVLSEYASTRSHLALLESLSEIKQSLVELSLRT